MKKTKKISGYTRFMALSPAQKESFYRECENPEVTPRAKPLDPAMRKAWNRAKRKAGRPRIGRGAQRVLISIERGLLEDADALAKRRHVTRSQLFSEGVRNILSKAG